MSRWCMLFGSLLFVFACNEAKYPEISLTEAIAKIQSGDIDQVEALGESTLLITEKTSAKTFQADINGQFDRLEAIASNAHFEGTIGSYEFQPKPESSLTTAYYLIFGGLLFGVMLLLRFFAKQR